MQIEDLKTWQWVALGLLAGLAFSLVLLVSGPSFATAELDTVDASTFEHALLGRLLRGGKPPLLAQFHKDQPVVRNIVVHPPFRGDVPGRYWVTGELYTVGPRYKDPSNPTKGEYYAEQWQPFKYPAMAPYKGQNGAVGNYPNVSGYLAAMEVYKPAQGVKPPPFAYRVAWQETQAALWTLPPLAGLLMVGIAWPMSLGVMRRIGMARPPKVIEKPKPAPEPMPVIKPVTGVRLAPPPPPPPPKPVLHPDDKEYGGEFYPVVKATHQE